MHPIFQTHTHPTALAGATGALAGVAGALAGATDGPPISLIGM